jgi:hypothetical protein
MIELPRRLRRMRVRYKPPKSLVDSVAVRRLRLQRTVVDCAKIELGLQCLGVDTANVWAIARGAEYIKELKALPPVEESELAAARAAELALANTPYGQKMQARFNDLVARYRDPAVPPPNFARESHVALLAYVKARVSDESMTRAKADALRAVGLGD